VAERGAAPRAPRLPPVVLGLGVVSFLNDLASEMVYPLLPLLMTRGLGAGALALGALDGIADAVSAAVKLGAGWLSDRPAWRRPLIVGGYVAAAVTRPLMAAAGAAWHVVALRAADRVGKGARNPPRDAVIADAARTSDTDAYKVCRDIAKAIEEQLNYPGEIKVTVIRETRVIEFAR